MTGTLIQRPAGSWSIVVYLGRDPITGKKRQKWSTFGGNKKQAQAELTRLLHELNTGAYIEATKLTVSAYLKRWLDNYAKTNVSGKTFERYEEIIRNQILPALGSIPLASLKPLHIQTFYSDALRTGRCRRGANGEAGLSAQTVLHVHRLLRDALGRAVKWQILIRNPADAVEPPKPARIEMRALSEAETAWLLEVARGTRFYMPVLIGVTTGMRRGEFLALRWDDLENGAAAVRRSVEQTNAGIRLKSTKGRNGRSIALMAITIEALEQHRKLQTEQRKAVGAAYRDEGLICSQEDGSLWKPNTFTAGFRALAKKAGLAGVRLHDLRHSHATQLLMQGVHPKVVSERLGHSSVGITLDVYSHVLPGIQEDAAKKLNLSLGAAIKKQESDARISKGLAN